MFIQNVDCVGYLENLSLIKCDRHTVKNPKGKIQGNIKSRYEMDLKSFSFHLGILGFNQF